MYIKIQMFGKLAVAINFVINDIGEEYVFKKTRGISKF